MDNEKHIGRKINILSNKIKRKLSNEAARFGVTSVQARILGFVKHESCKRDIFQKDIEEELDIRRSSVTSVLQLMEKNGYITRISVSEDARLKKIILTEKGILTEEKLHSHVLNLEETLRRGFTDDEINTLMNFINILCKKIDD